MTKEDRCHIGTSGWSYGHWKEVFYPKDVKEKDFLSFYSEHFSTVEINNSFYHLPRAETVRRWRDMVSEDFIFAVKGSRYITHIKRLNEPEESISRFFEVIDNLDYKTGPILFQLSPSFKINIQRLRDFLIKLPEEHNYTFEFRNKSWFDEDVYNLLSQYNAAFCIYDMGGDITPLTVTADFVYVRLHGPGQAYGGDYSKKHLTKWAKIFEQWIDQGKRVYCYFNNDQSGYAVKNALNLKKILGLEYAFK